MPIVATSYGLRPSCEDQIAEIFNNFQRTGSRMVHGAHGTEVGRILPTVR